MRQRAKHARGGQVRAAGSFEERRGRVEFLSAPDTRWAADLLPRYYQSTPYQDDLGGHPVSSDRFSLFSLGRFGCPDYVARGNS